MSNTKKTVRLSGDAPDSIEDAITTVLGRAALTIDDIQNFRVVEISGQVDEAGVPSGYRVTMDITFVVRSGDEPL